MRRHDDALNQAIAETFPTLQLDEPVINEHHIADVLRKVEIIAQKAVEVDCLQISLQQRCASERCFRFAATLPCDPNPDEWLFHCDRHQKLEFIGKTGRNVGIWWVSFSFVYPIWRHHFNVWSPRVGAPGYVDCDLVFEPPGMGWKRITVSAGQVAQAHGFDSLTSEELLRITPVSYEEFTDDDSDEAVLTESTVAQCLFSET